MATPATTSDIAIKNPGKRSRLWPLLLGVFPAAFLIWSYSCFGSTRVAVSYLRGLPIAVDTMSIDAGTGKAGERREVTFRLWNLSRQPVRILGSSTSCTCLSADELPVNLAAGQSREFRVRVAYKPGGESFREAMTFYTDAPARSKFQITVQGHSSKDVRPEQGAQ